MDRPDRPFPFIDADADGAILVYLKGFGPGGVERIALRLVAGWRDAGLPVDLLLADATGPMRDAGDAPLHKAARLWPIVGTRWPLLRLAFDTAALVRRRRPALLFCPGNAYMGAAALLKLLLGRRCPPIVAKVSNDLERRDMAPALRLAYRLWLRLLGRLIDHFAVLSAPMAAEAQRLLHISPSRIHIVPNPVLSLADLAVLRPRATRQSGRRFIAVGRLEPQKDYPLMLRAFAAARAPGDTLTILGEGRERDRLEREVARLGLDSCVYFTGHCTDVRARMAQHDILLLTSAYEGQPGAVVEALSVGLGIVATRCCASMADLLEDGALGKLVDRGDDTALVRAIAAAHPAMQDRDRARARAHAFTIEAAVPAYAALFAKATAADRQPAILPHPMSYRAGATQT